jgi:hypothetical protein
VSPRKAAVSRAASAREASEAFAAGWDGSAARAGEPRTDRERREAASRREEVLRQGLQ